MVSYSSFCHFLKAKNGSLLFTGVDFSEGEPSHIPFGHLLKSLIDKAEVVKYFSGIFFVVCLSNAVIDNKSLPSNAVDIGLRVISPFLFITKIFLAIYLGLAKTNPSFLRTNPFLN